MSLRKAVEQIVEDMEVEIKKHSQHPTPGEQAILLSYRASLKMLQMALRASEGETPVQDRAITASAQGDEYSIMASASRWAQAEKMRKLKTQGKDVEDSEAMSLQCQFGPADDSYHTVPAGMPDGAHTEVLPGHVYTKQGNFLIYNKEQSVKSVP